VARCIRSGIGRASQASSDLDGSITEVIIRGLNIGSGRNYWKIFSTEGNTRLSIEKIIQKIKSLPGIAEIIAVIGGVIFLFQALHFAHIQESILDEGLYLVKGYLFASGHYTPFQPDGPWTNQMPLSYLIPGFMQMLFGSGLRSGRYFSVLLGILILVGLWIIARRLGGRWWAAGMVWIVAINPAFANGYSMAVSQALVACILTWVLVLALDEKAALWRLVLASVMAGLLILVRVNMTPVLPVLLIYIFWQFGKRPGLWATLAGGLVVIIGHAFYWPGILQMWASWIPAGLSHFLDPWRIENLGIAIWDPNLGLEDRLASFWDGARYNFIPILALAIFGVLILQRKYWKNQFHYRSAVFLTILSGLLFLAHAWAALWKSYCVFCFSGYLEFFSPVIVLLILLTYQSWRPAPGKWFTFPSLFTGFALAIILILFSGVGYGISRGIGPALIEVQIPRILIGRLGGGSVSLWGLLENSLGVDYKTSRWLIPTLAGLVVGLVLILAAWLASRSDRLKAHRPANFGLFAAGLAILLGAALTPTPLLTGSEQTNVCQGDQIAAMEGAGKALAQVVPPGALVYWQGSLSTVPLLSIPQARIFPAQLNDGYSFRLGGDTTALRQFGLWNDILRDQWLNEADFIIIQERYYDQGWKQFLESGAFNELAPTPGTDPCKNNSGLRIFRRIL